MFRNYQPRMTVPEDFVNCLCALAGAYKAREAWGRNMSSTTFICCYGRHSPRGTAYPQIKVSLCLNMLRSYKISL